MPRLRNEKEFFWTFSGTIKEFREALKILNKNKKDVFEPAMARTINKAKTYENKTNAPALETKTKITN